MGSSTWPLAKKERVERRNDGDDAGLVDDNSSCDDGLGVGKAAKERFVRFAGLGDML